MAKDINPAPVPARNLLIPGLKPPVWEFAPTDNGDPAEVDAFISMIRELRSQGSYRDPVQPTGPK